MNKSKHTILILGGTGFLGRNLVEELLATGNYNVVVFDRQPFSADYLSSHPGLRMCSGDFNVLADLIKVFGEYHFDSVVHLIATSVPSMLNGENLIGDVESNLVPTLRLLSLMQEKGVRRIVFASSGGTVYGISPELSGRPIPETAVTSPVCSYGITKLIIEKYLALYKHLFGLEYLIFRMANPFGEHHRSEVQGLINVVLKKAINGQEIQIWGDGDVVRDYIYVKDCALAMRLLMEKDLANETINIGSGAGYSVNEILSFIAKLAGPLRIERSGGRKFDVPRVVLDISKMKELINMDFVPLEEGISRTYHWYKKEGV